MTSDSATTTIDLYIDRLIFCIFIQRADFHRRSVIGQREPFVLGLWNLYDVMIILKIPSSQLHCCHHRIYKHINNLILYWMPWSRWTVKSMSDGPGPGFRWKMLLQSPAAKARDHKRCMATAATSYWCTNFGRCLHRTKNACILYRS